VQFQFTPSIFDATFFYLTSGIRNFAPTNPEDAHALSKKFPASAPWLIHGANTQFNGPKKQFTLGGF
jgi:hypothetical protein